jgi:hypothetical protein
MKSRIIGALAVLGLIMGGCTGQVFGVCPGVPGWGQVVVQDMEKCDLIPKWEAKARPMLAGAELGSDTSGWTLYVKPTHDWTSWDGLVWGETNAVSQTVSVSEDGFGLLHELIHVHQTQVGQLDTFLHTGWCERGYGQADCPGSLDAEFVTWINGQRAAP